VRVGAPAAASPTVAATTSVPSADGVFPALVQDLVRAAAAAEAEPPPAQVEEAAPLPSAGAADPMALFMALVVGGAAPPTPAGAGQAPTDIPAATVPGPTAVPSTSVPDGGQPAPATAEHDPAAEGAGASAVPAPSGGLLVEEAEAAGPGGPPPVPDLVSPSAPGADASPGPQSGVPSSPRSGDRADRAQDGSGATPPVVVPDVPRGPVAPSPGPVVDASSGPVEPPAPAAAAGAGAPGAPAHDAAVVGPAVVGTVPAGSDTLAEVSVGAGRARATSVASQVAHHVADLVQTQASGPGPAVHRLTLRLDPPHLGPVGLVVTMRGDHLHVAVEASSEVRTMLQAGAGDLHSMLGQIGVSSDPELLLAGPGTWAGAGGPADRAAGDLSRDGTPTGEPRRDHDGSGHAPPAPGRERVAERDDLPPARHGPGRRLDLDL
jgi:hypothetical protein